MADEGGRVENWGFKGELAVVLTEGDREEIGEIREAVGVSAASSASRRGRGGKDCPGKSSSRTG